MPKSADADKLYWQPVWRMTIVKAFVEEQEIEVKQRSRLSREQFSQLLNEELLECVHRPGQYLGNEWGAYRKDWRKCDVHLALAFPDLYELGMSNFGLRILYQIINNKQGFLADRTYAPENDMELLLRQRGIPLWGFESRQALDQFELIGFSLQYELTYTNVLNMLELANLPVKAVDRQSVFPLIFAGGPASVNPEPMASFMDFFLIGDGESSLPHVMEIVRQYQCRIDDFSSSQAARHELLTTLARQVPGVYVPCLYQANAGNPVVKPIAGVEAPQRISRQVEPLTDENQPTGNLVPYLSLVHDREVLEVRRGCDRGCRFCQPGYTFLPVRERTADDLLRLSSQALSKSGQQEYSMLSLCVSDYTALHDAVRALNREHSRWRASMSFPSQRADRMNLDLAPELKAVRKSGITLAPEAGTERLRAVINKGLNHKEIISAITAAYQSGWSSIKLYFMLGLPTETDEDLFGIVDILKEATELCRQMARSDSGVKRRAVEFTCTISNFVPKPFTPFQWYGQISVAETERRQAILKEKMRQSGLRNVALNFTDPQISLLEAVISRGCRQIADLIFRAWQKGCTFDAWNDRFQPAIWHVAASELSLSLESLASKQREVGSRQAWDIVHVGLNDWWLTKEWQKAMSQTETAPCTEHACHACGICVELNTSHLLAQPDSAVMAKNPFVKELVAHDLPDSHPSLFFIEPPKVEATERQMRIRFVFHKIGQMRFISHLDLQHLFHRACRRAKIAVSFSNGFNPQPRLSLAVSLPLFQLGLSEIAEIDLAESLDPSEFMARLNRELPFEVQVIAAKAVPATGPSLASCLGRALYQAKQVIGTTSKAAKEASGTVARLLDVYDFNSDAQKNLVSQVTDRLDTILASPTVEVSQVDIRPGIFSLSMRQEFPLLIEMDLAAGPRMHVKPGDLLSLLGVDINWRVTRLGLATSDGIPLFNLPSSGSCQIA